MPPPKILEISSNPLRARHPLIAISGHELQFGRRVFKASLRIG
jgi:hypothetical protein